VSIAVMNWVWTSSPTSSNERLVLLALADACSRDDGSGCWPSVATIARKANISDRTVRRVIARLEAEGHLVVHRGGGRSGSTNSYTVVTDIHSPGQSVTPDSLSGGDIGDRPPLTQLCQGTPDTAVSPDPPKNHQGTAALGDAWRLTETQRARLTPAVEAALGAGRTRKHWLRSLGRTPRACGIRTRCWPPGCPLPNCLRCRRDRRGRRGAGSAIR